MRRPSRKLVAAIWISLLALVLAPLASSAQSASVRGKVADSTGAPITGAVVALDPGGLRATTRDNGEYIISRVAPGTYSLRVRRLGYFAPTQTVVVAEG